MEFRKYHCVKQYDIKNCRAACLAPISKQYGLKEQQLDLVRVTQDNDALLNSGLISAAQTDQNKLDLLNLNRLFDKQKVKYALFQAKVTLALRGVIL
ncbi:hypothetical protein D3C76_286990 [compost metagenome]